MATRVYITPFNSSGDYDTEIEVTNDVIQVGKIDQDTDSSEFQIGVYRSANVRLDLSNRSGQYGDIDVTQSIFQYKRADSKVRITWKLNERSSQCGTAICGSAPLGEEITIFEGLLNDDTYNISAKEEKASFVVLGYQTLFERNAVPYTSLSVLDTLSVTLYKILNQSGITDILTVSQANIVPGLDQVPDSITDLQNLSVKDALDALLLLSNSVLYIQNSTVYISNRDAGAAVAYSFFGPASAQGAENIVDISNLNNGRQRVFNYFNWQDTTSRVQDTDSVLLNGFRKKVVGGTYFTDVTKITNFLNELLAEFKDAKREMELTTDMNYDTIALNLLDRVDIDYPTVYEATEGHELPICGIAICGEAVLPFGAWNLTISQDANWKIIKKSLDPAKHLVTFKLREI